MIRPFIKRQLSFKRLQTPGAFTMQTQPQTSLNEDRVVQLLQFQIVEKRLFKVNQFIQALQPQVGRRQFAFQREIVLLQVTNVELQRHTIPSVGLLVSRDQG